MQGQKKLLETYHFHYLFLPYDNINETGFVNFAFIELRK